MSETTDGPLDEPLDQLQPDDTLIDRGVPDVLDEGYTAPEKWSAAEGFGNTPAEQAEGESLDRRLAQEEPEAEPAPEPDPNWRHGESRQCGSRRAGRLVDARGGYPGADTEPESVGGDVGIDGGAASAEEAAMHVIDSDDVEDAGDDERG